MHHARTIEKTLNIPYSEHVASRKSKPTHYIGISSYFIENIETRLHMYAII